MEQIETYRLLVGLIFISFLMSQKKFPRQPPLGSIIPSKEAHGISLGTFVLGSRNTLCCVLAWWLSWSAVTCPGCEAELNPSCLLPLGLLVFVFSVLVLLWSLLPRPCQSFAPPLGFGSNQRCRGTCSYSNQERVVTVLKIQTEAAAYLLHFSAGRGRRARCCPCCCPKKGSKNVGILTYEFPSRC